MSTVNNIADRVASSESFTTAKNLSSISNIETNSVAIDAGKLLANEAIAQANRLAFENESLEKLKSGALEELTQMVSRNGLNKDAIKKEIKNQAISSAKDFALKKLASVEASTSLGKLVKGAVLSEASQRIDEVVGKTYSQRIKY